MKRVMQNKQQQADKKNNVDRKKAHRSRTSPHLNGGHPPPEKVQPIDKCRSTLLDKLRNLKDLHILRASLMPNDSTFEVLEFYGDSVLYERISFFLMQTRRFCSPHLLTQMRCAVVQNKNLATAFDTLGLVALLPESAKSLPMKGKADVVEAIIGELSESCAHSGNSNIDTTLAKGALDELLAYICYTGEREYFIVDELNKPSCSSEQNIKKTAYDIAPMSTQPMKISSTSTSSREPSPKKIKKPLARATSALSLQGHPSRPKELRQEANLANERQTKPQPSTSPVNVAKPTPTVHTPQISYQAYPVQQPKLLLYSEMPGFSSPSGSPPSTTASVTSLPFPQVDYSNPWFSSASPSMKVEPSSPSRSLTDYLPTSSYPKDYLCANTHLGGRSITEFNVGVTGH